MAKSRVDEIKEEIKCIQRQIDAPNTSEKVRAVLKTALTGAQKALEEEEGKSKEPTKKPAETPSAKVKEKTDDNVAGKKKPKAAKKVVAPKADVDADLPETVTVTVNGHTETIKIVDCESALRAMKLRKARDVESSNKTKSRLPADAAAKSAENMVDHVTDMITAKKIKENPEEIIKTMGKFEKKLSEAVEVWDGVISSTGIAKIQKAIKEVIEEEIKAIQKSADKK